MYVETGINPAYTEGNRNGRTGKTDNGIREIAHGQVLHRWCGWTTDNLDNCRDTIQKCLEERSCESLCGESGFNGTVTPNGKLSVKSSQS